MSKVSMYVVPVDKQNNSSESYIYLYKNKESGNIERAYPSNYNMFLENDNYLKLLKAKKKRLFKCITSSGIEKRLPINTYRIVLDEYGTLLSSEPVYGDSTEIYTTNSKVLRKKL